MTLKRTTLRVGLGVGGFGVVANVFTILLTYVLPEYVLGEEAATAFLTTWYDPIFTAGSLATVYGTAVVAVAAGFYLVYARETPTSRALAALALGGIGFALWVTMTGWALTAPALRVTTAEYATRTATLVGFVVGGSLFGTLLGGFVADLGESSSAEANA